jgi:predicted aldo/keto reductase-like oxidoreductase
VDIEQTKQMVDAFLDAGFNYFDTAHGYIQGKSEKVLKTCLTSRYPREKYILTDKLTANYFKAEADIRPFFESQLEICGVEYFDFYLMHAQGLVNYDHFKECRAYETAFELKKEGKIRHVGISFHDRAEVLERILTEYPEIEVVQIQFNYVDYDDPAVQSRKCYEVCRKFGKPVIVMEPVKGGNLVNLPEDAKAVLDELHGGGRGGRVAVGADTLGEAGGDRAAADDDLELLAHAGLFEEADDFAHGVHRRGHERRKPDDAGLFPARRLDHRVD